MPEAGSCWFSYSLHSANSPWSLVVADRLKVVALVAAVTVASSSQVKVILRSTISRPVHSVIRHPSVKREQFFSNSLGNYPDI